MASPPPPNSILFYCHLRGITPNQIAKQLGINHQTLNKWIDRDSGLSPHRAQEIGAALDIPYSYIGFSDAPDAYPWAVRAVPVVGSVMPHMQLQKLSKARRRIASPVGGPGWVAYEIPEPVSFRVGGWFLLFNTERSAQLPVTPEVIEAKNTDLVVRLTDGTQWWRMLAPGQIPNRYTLKDATRPPIYDVEVKSVTKAQLVPPPICELPPPLPDHGFTRR